MGARRYNEVQSLEEPGWTCCDTTAKRGTGRRSSDAGRPRRHRPRHPRRLHRPRARRRRAAPRRRDRRGRAGRARRRPARGGVREALAGGLPPGAARGAPHRGRASPSPSAPSARSTTWPAVHPRSRPPSTRCAATSGRWPASGSRSSAAAAGADVRLVNPEPFPGLRDLRRDDARHLRRALPGRRARPVPSLVGPAHPPPSAAPDPPRRAPRRPGDLRLLGLRDGDPARRLDRSHAARRPGAAGDAPAAGQPARPGRRRRDDLEMALRARLRTPAPRGQGRRGVGRPDARALRADHEPAAPGDRQDAGAASSTPSARRRRSGCWPRGGPELSDVAFRLGFSDQTAWNRAFRRWKGMSPTEWLQARSAPGAAFAAPLTPAEGGDPGDGRRAHHPRHHRAPDAQHERVGAGQVEPLHRGRRPEPGSREAIGRGREPVDLPAGVAGEVGGRERGRELPVHDQPREPREPPLRRGQQGVGDPLLRAPRTPRRASSSGSRPRARSGSRRAPAMISAVWARASGSFIDGKET